MSEPILKILIVEDDRMFRAYALQAVKKHQAKCAENLADARKMFALEKPDIIFLDIELPDGNGLDFLREVRTDFPDLHVVMMTGSKDVENVKKAKELNVAGYILKPFNAQSLQQQINVFVNKNKTNAA